MSDTEQFTFENRGRVGVQIAKQVVSGDVKQNFFIAADALPNHSNETTIDAEILNSLAFKQMFDRRATVEKAHPHTCEWCLDLEVYRQWVESTRGLLWIKGKPGAGKSTLMSFLYDNLKRRNGQSPRILLNFFFSARAEELQRTPLGMFRALLNQLFLHDHAIRPDVREVYLEKSSAFGLGEVQWTWQLQELESLLTDAIISAAERQQVVIFIDALDEAGEENARKMLKFFHKVNGRVAQAQTKAKIIVSCRHYPIIHRIKAVEICVEDHNRPDILNFVNDRLNLGHMIESYDQSEWKEIAEYLCSKASGVFQWVVLVMVQVERSIIQGDSLEEVRSWLRTVPQELDNIYEEALGHVIRAQHTSQALILFSCVLYMKGTLGLTEIQLAILYNRPNSSLSSDPGKLTHENLRTDDIMFQRVQLLSGGLLKVVGRHNEVEVIHETVREFLKARGFLMLLKAEHHSMPGTIQDYKALTLDEAKQLCHMKLHMCCLNYWRALSAEIDLENAHSKLSNHEEVKHLSLLKYATKNLFHHAEKTKCFPSHTMPMYASILQNILPKWLFVSRNIFGIHSKEVNAGNSVLHIAAARSLLPLALYLITGGADINAQNVNGETPFHLAVIYGRESVVVLLKESGADADVQTSQNDTILTLAVAYGRETIVRWLLQAGLDPNKPLGQERPLHAAALCKDVAMTQLLLASGADPNVDNIIQETPLQISSHLGTTHAVVALLQGGADPNRPCGLSKNALQLASEKGHDDIVSALLKAGAYADASSNHGDTALVLASKQGHASVVQLLLKAGASRTVRQNDSRSAVEEASHSGQEHIVRLLLLSNHPHLESPSSKDPITTEELVGNSLTLAAAAGHSAIVSLLLIEGALGSLESDRAARYENALSAAARGGHVKVLSLLLTDDYRSFTTYNAVVSALEARRQGYSQYVTDKSTRIGTYAPVQLRFPRIGSKGKDKLETNLEDQKIDISKSRYDQVHEMLEAELTRVNQHPPAAEHGDVALVYK